MQSTLTGEIVGVHGVVGRCQCSSSVCNEKNEVVVSARIRRNRAMNVEDSHVDSTGLPDSRWWVPFVAGSRALQRNAGIDALVRSLLVREKGCNRCRGGRCRSVMFVLEGCADAGREGWREHQEDGGPLYIIRQARRHHNATPAERTGVEIC